MGQVTIYLDDEMEKKMVEAAQSAHVSKSKWVAGLIRERLATEWPESVTHLAGAWEDFPLAEEMRAELGEDAEREPL